VRSRIGRAAHASGVATRSDIRGLLAEQEILANQNAALQQRVAEVADALEVAEQQLERRLEVLEAIQSFKGFIEHAELESTPLVSIVLPTRDRPELLRRAIGSALAQRYEAWELLVVDDGEIETSREIVNTLAEPRIRWARSEKRGASGARNVALEMARGELIAYLDDDNMMDRGWLYSAVWAFEQRPEVDVLYGAFVVDDPLRVAGESSGGFPTTYLHQWSTGILRQRNPADLGAIVHRSGLPEARFDETLRRVVDWDLLARLTASGDPLVVPAVACYYMTDAAKRLSADPTKRGDIDTVRRRAAMLRP
jgi:hypothetical protein